MIIIIGLMQVQVSDSVGLKKGIKFFWHQADAQYW